MNNSQVVVDASFLLKLFLPEKKSEKAQEHWKVWIEKSVEVVASTLIIFEVSSVIRNKTFRGILEEGDASEIIRQVNNLQLTLIYNEDLLDLSWGIGSILKTPALYDCFYIALSKFLNVPLWTADNKLYGISKKKFPLINLI